PEFFENNRAAYESYGMAEVRLAPYQQTDDFLDVAAAWHNDVGFNAVVPCWEYAVRPAGRLAEKLGLRFPGSRAVVACTDKYELRKAAAGIGVTQPRFAAVSSAADVHEFFTGA